MTLLSSHGHLPLEADDAAAAIALARRENPCLVLLDLGMPGADGFAFLRFRAASDELRALPVVIASARLDHDLPLPCLRKPFTIDDLLSAIRAHTTCGCVA